MARLGPVFAVNTRAFVAASSGMAATALWPKLSLQSEFGLLLYAYFGAASVLALSAGLGALRVARDAFVAARREAAFREQGSGLHTARWASEKEMEAAGMFEPIGRPLGMTMGGRAIFEPHRLRPVHGKIMAIAGSGKTTAGVVPAIMHYALSPDRPSVVAFDLKGGELASQCAPALQARGLNVVVIDDTRETELPPTAVNPFGILAAAAQRGDAEAATVARKFALVLEPEPREGDAKNKFFRDGPREIITFGLLALAHDAPEDCTPLGLWALISMPAAFDAALEKIYGVPAIDALAARILERREASPDHAADFLTTARQKLEIYEAGGLLDGAGQGATFRHEEIKDGGTVVFVVGSQANIDVLENHVMLHLSAFSYAIKRAGGRTVHLIMEELSNTPATSLVSELTILRAYGGRALMIAQQESELIRRFGEQAARTIDGQSSVKQIFGVALYEDAVRLSKQLGTMTGVARSMSKKEGKLGLDENLSDPGRPLLSPEEILALPRDEQILLCLGMKPIRCRKLYQNEIGPWGGELAPNPMEGGALPFRPKIQISYGKA